MTYVPRKSGLLAAFARCPECGWESEARNAVGNAAQHAARTGHTVQAEQTIATIFNPEDKGG